MKRVLHIIRPANLSGAPVAMLNLVVELQNRFGYEISVACSSEGELSDELREKKINVIICPHLTREISPLNDLSAFFDLYRIIRRGDYDIVHTHSSKSGILGRWAAKIAKVPVIIHTYNGIPWIGSRFYQWAEKATARVTNHLIAVSQSDKQFLVETAIGTDQRTHVIANGLDGEALLQTCASSHLSTIGVTDAPIIGMVARLKDQKYPELFIKMAHEVLQHEPTCQFVLVGDGELRASTENLASELGISNNVFFLGWRDDAWELIKTFTVFVLTSRFEGLPVVLIETSFLGVPVVATDVRGSRDIIVDGHNGLLGPLEEKGLAEKVLYLLQNPNIRSKLVDEAQKFAIQHYDIRHIAAATHEVYSS